MVMIIKHIRRTVLLCSMLLMPSIYSMSDQEKAREIVLVDFPLAAKMMKTCRKGCSHLPRSLREDCKRTCMESCEEQRMNFLMVQWTAKCLKKPSNIKWKLGREDYRAEGDKAYELRHKDPEVRRCVEECFWKEKKGKEDEFKKGHYFDKLRSCYQGFRLMMPEIWAEACEKHNEVARAKNQKK